MARYLFDGGELVFDPSGVISPNVGFTVWTEPFAGDDVTADMMAPDGVTPATAETDGDGEIPYLRGPDGVKGPLFRDHDTGTRSAWYSAEAVEETDVLAVETRAIVDATGPALPGGGNNGDFLTRIGDRQGAWAPLPGGGGGSSDWVDITNKPATFPPSSHQHGSGEISDATSVGRAVLTAVDMNAARQSIGAGTGNGTSNLALGSTATTAAPGNHSHAAAGVTYVPQGVITAVDVQTAIQQASTTGGAGSSDSMEWIYQNGTYPALPATQPAGLRTVRASGPTYPTTIPAWLGPGASQTKLAYSKAPWV